MSKSRTFQNLPLLLILLASSTVLTNNHGYGHGRTTNCPEGQTPTSVSDRTCIPCAQAAHSKDAEGNTVCSECSRHHAACELCNQGFFNPSVEGTKCTPCATVTGCATCRRQFDQQWVGCEMCEAGKIMYNTNPMAACTQCRVDPNDANSAVNLQQCPKCGNKDATNCKKCHSNFGCHQCAHGFDFDPQSVTEVGGKIYGKCTVCKRGYIGSQPGRCDLCAEGFEMNDGKCQEINEVTCDGHKILGCKRCGVNNPALCAECAEGYGLNSIEEEAAECMVCGGRWCADCRPEYVLLKKCVRCKQNFYESDPEYCLTEGQKTDGANNGDGNANGRGENSFSRVLTAAFGGLVVAFLTLVRF